MRKFRRVVSNFFQQTRRFWLALLVCILLLSCLIYFGLYTYLTTDSNSALYLLSTIAQSSASIIAIVISLSLLVVQYSATTYSARVVDIFKNDIRLWALIFFYGFSIIFSLIVIRLIKDLSNGYLYLGINCLEICYTLALLLSFAAYISLIAYIPYVLKMMKSSSVIGLLSEKIDIKSLSNSSDKVDELESKISKDEPRINRIIINLHDEEDPFLPIFDIIRASIMRYDYATARNGLWAVSICLYNIIKQNPHEEKRISEHVFKRIYEIWKLALKIKDSGFIYIILMQYWYIGNLCTFSLRKPDSTYINFLLKLKTKFFIPIYNTFNEPYYEEKVTQNNLLYTTFLSEYYIKETLKSLLEVKDEEFQNLSVFLAIKINEIGSKTFENCYELKVDKSVEILESLECSTSEFSYILKDIGIASINVGSKSTFEVVINTFNYIGEAAVYYNLIHSVAHILKNLKIVGEESAKKGGEFEPLTKQIVERLESLASKIDTHSKELAGETQIQVIEYYEHIKQKYEYKRTEHALEELNDRVERDIRDTYCYIAMIGEESIKNGLLDATLQSLKSLETVERILQDDTESRRICEMIRDIGLEAVKKDQTYPLMEDIIKSIYSIGMLQFGYMFDWNRDLEQRQEFLKKEHTNCLKKGLQLSYSDFIDTVDFKYVNDREQTLIINGNERKDLKCLSLKNIDATYYSRFHALKLFKNDIFENSETAYYKVPEFLEEFIDPILEYTLKSPSDETIKLLGMITQCFENFGIISANFRDTFSLDIFIRFLVTMGDSLVDNSINTERFIRSQITTGNSLDNSINLEDNKDQKARECLELAAAATSDSIYKLAIQCLKYNLVDSNTFQQLVWCLIYIEKEYPDAFYWEKDKLERILEKIKESELEESERDKIIKLISENGKPIKMEKVGVRWKAVRHTPKRRAIKRMKEESS